MSDERKMRVWPWIAALLIGLPVLYVLSSGPTQTVAFRSHVSYLPVLASSGPGSMAAVSDIDMGRWWPGVYAPLLWVSEQSWGDPLNWYWALFPISETP
jgi:hypothetical protein